MAVAGTLCVVFNNVDESSSIGSLCAWSVRTALVAGWRVSVVARDLARDLRTDVEWLPLYVPPRLHAVQWYAALPTVRRAMAGRRWDVVHTQQPQLTPVADILHLHYLIRSARLAGPEPRPLSGLAGAKQRAGRVQTRLTEAGESHQLRRLPERVELVPVSAMLQQEFERHYGPHARTTVLESPAPEPVHLTGEERAAARERLVGGRPGPVLGFLGGGDPRKGGRALLAAIGGTEATALVAGHGADALVAAAPGTRAISLGYVSDRRTFFAACDAFAAVSTFDPGPLTALEAAAHGVPVVGTSGCGIVRDLVGAGAAVLWRPGDAIGPVLAQLDGGREPMAAAGHDFVASRSAKHQGERLLAIYEAVRGRRAISRT